MGASHSREGDLDSLYSEDEDDYSQSSEHRSNSPASNLGSRLQGFSLDDNALGSFVYYTPLKTGLTSNTVFTNAYSWRFHKWRAWAWILSMPGTRVTHSSPGFKFNPNDEELITHYLVRKVLDNTFTHRGIVQVDLNTY